MGSLEERKTESTTKMLIMLLYTLNLRIFGTLLEITM